MPGLAPGVEMRYWFLMLPAHREWLRPTTRWLAGARGSFAWLAGLGVLLGISRADSPVSFRRDVMQLLSKGGCNAGACHGNASGKGGFKLSLRGEDPEADYRALVEELSGRRINRVQPEESLLLLKPIAAVAHEGGQRFAADSPAYLRLREWISGGALNDHTTAPVPTRLEVWPTQQVLLEPERELTIRAVAHFADGSHRDVSTEAVYEASNPLLQISPAGRVQREHFGESVVLVRYLNQQLPVRILFAPARPDFRWANPQPANYIDEHIFAKLRTVRLNPGEIANDALYLRRAYLDLLGRLPSPNETRAFLSDTAEGKRGELIDRLLDRPEFAEFWALKWSDLLRVEERTLDRKGMGAFHNWIRESFATNKPLDQFVRELITARGSTYAQPAANFYRANRTPIDRALTVSQVFLGTRLNCAQCHNHPFDRWSQDDYHDWGAVFARVNYKVLRNDRKDENDSHEFKGEQIVYVAASGELPNPRTGKAAVPRMLGMNEPMGASGASEDAAAAGDPRLGPRRFGELETLARWLTSPTNHVFARVQANRLWFHLMGRGLVDPVDDFRATNPASHPELLEALGADFAQHGFDVRHLIRTIMNSRTYQVGPAATATEAEDELNYSRSVPRRLSAEQLLDAQHQVTGVPFSRENYPGLTRAVQLPGGTPLKQKGASLQDGFLQVFGKPKRLLSCECERSEATTMAQALELISGPSLHQLITKDTNALSRGLEADPSGETAVDELYWSALARAPQPAELARIRQLLTQAPDVTGRRAVLEDVTWALLNSKEFVLRQ